MLGSCNIESLFDLPQDHTIASAFLKRIQQRLESGDYVLDIGAGTGLLGSMIASLVSNVTMIEPDRSSLILARERCISQQLNNINFIHGDIYSAGCRKADILLFFMSLHHIEDITGVIAKCKSLCKTGTQIIIGDFYSENVPFHIYDQVPHNGLSPKRLSQLLKDCGFRITECRPFYLLEKLNKEKIIHYPLFLLTGIFEKE